MMCKDPFVPFNRLASGAGMPQAVEHDAGKLRVFRISWVFVKQFSRNDTATACQDWLRVPG